MNRYMRLVCVPMALLAIPSLRAQTSTAQITGRVSDPSDAVVSGAKVRIRNMDTGETRDTTTSDSGYYTAPLLDLGRYQVNVEVSGFKPITRTNVTLQVDQVYVYRFPSWNSGSSAGKSDTR